MHIITAIATASALAIQAAFVYAWCFTDSMIGGWVSFALVMSITIFVFMAGMMFGAAHVMGMRRPKVTTRGFLRKIA